MTVINLKCINDGNEYQIDSKQHSNLENLLFFAKDEMIKPCISHFVSWIHQHEHFDKTNFATNLKRQLGKIYKSNRPNFLYAYSIEHKYTTQAEIDGNFDYGIYDYSDSDTLLEYLHIHIYVIMDCHKIDPANMPIAVVSALDKLDGLTKSHYLPSYDGMKYKELNDNSVDDIFNRIIYIAKLNQKSSDIPFRQTFGMSKLISSKQQSA